MSAPPHRGARGVFSQAPCFSWALHITGGRSRWGMGLQELARAALHLISLLEPLTHDSTFVRTQPPETPSPSPHPLGAPVPRSRPSPFPTSHSRLSGGRQGGAGAAGGGWAPIAATQVGSGGAAAQAPRPPPADTHSAPPGPGVTCGRVTADAEGARALPWGVCEVGWARTRCTAAASTAPRGGWAGWCRPEGGYSERRSAPSGATRVLRTLYMPNEKIDSLLLSIESLRAQLQEQVRATHRPGWTARNRRQGPIRRARNRRQGADPEGQKQTASGPIRKVTSRLNRRATSRRAEAGGGRRDGGRGPGRASPIPTPSPTPLQRPHPLVQPSPLPFATLPTPSCNRPPLQASLSRERVSALLEDRRLRIAEDAARRATEAQHAQAVEEALTRSEALLVVRCGMGTTSGWCLGRLGLFCAGGLLAPFVRGGVRRCRGWAGRRNAPRNPVHGLAALPTPATTRHTPPLHAVHNSASYPPPPAVRGCSLPHAHKHKVGVPMPAPLPL
eukprot:scaffold10391_cov94-Isochrysis_galbana.AAC.2